MGFRPVFQQNESNTLKSPNSLADSDVKVQNLKHSRPEFSGISGESADFGGNNKYRDKSQPMPKDHN